MQTNATLTASRVATRRSESWVLVERYVAHYPHDWRLVFRRGNEQLEVPVPEEVWRAFDVARSREQ